MPPKIHLKPERERSLRLHHPWVFSGAIARTDDAADGAVVDIVSAAGEFQARGLYNGRSQIAVRALTWDPAEAIDQDFFRQRVLAAVETRRRLGLEVGKPGNRTTAFRLIHGEADFLPGLIADVYGDFLVLQVLSLGLAQRLPELVAVLAETVKPAGIYQRSDVEVREREGLPHETGVLWGQPPPDRLTIRENGLEFLVEVKTGQKTGFFLDQRENRRSLAAFLAGFAAATAESAPLTVLNVFSYTGAFSVYALQACPRATVINLDSSAEALALARANFALNFPAGAGPQPAQFECLEGNAFELLRTFRDSRRSFDVIILDPPKFAQHQAQVEKACRGYKDLNLLAAKLLRPGGLLATFSCSGGISADLFRKVVFGAAMDACREAQILTAFSAGPDHPVRLSFPEGEYLKGLLLQLP